ncbi:MAG TPA: DUF190 domain-containing protein [Myxococcales bacterium]
MSTTPELLGRAKRVRIYVSEGDLHHHRPIEAAILALLRKEGASGATVLRGVEGFGGSGHLHTSRLAELTAQLPVVIEWVDTPDRVERLLPRVQEMIQRGLVTLEETEVVFFCPFPVRDVPSALRVGEVMSREVVSVSKDTPVRQVIEAMLGKDYRAVPVVEGGKPVGIVTNSDLLARGGLTIRLDLLPSLESPELHAELERLAKGARTASDAMTPAPLTVTESTPLPQAAELMAHRRLKRLPVVDERGMLVGMLSRLDILRTASRTLAAAAQPAPQETGLAADAPVARAMRRDFPKVHPETPLAQVLQAVIATRLNRCLVVDDAGRVLGKVTDAECLERVTPALRPSALRALVHRLPFAHPSPAERESEQHATARTAQDLMVPVAVVVGEETPLREAIAAMLPGKHKILAVVDDQRRLVGIVDRADLLHGLVDASRA